MDKASWLVSFLSRLVVGTLCLRSSKLGTFPSMAYGRPQGENMS